MSQNKYVINSDNESDDDFNIKNAIDSVFKLFYDSYLSYVKDNKHWSENLNLYIQTEWYKLDDNVAYLESQFNQDEQDDIIWKTFQKILKKLNISYDEYDEYEDSVNWDRLEELLSYYICFIIRE